MHRPNPRESPLLSRPRPPKVAPVPVAATSSPPSILSLAHVLGLVFASFFLLPNTHSLERLWLLHSLCINLFIPLLTHNPHPLAITRTSPVSAALIIPRSVPTSPINHSISLPSPPRTRHRRHLCHHPPCDTRPNTATCARQTLHQPASPYRKPSSYKAFLRCPKLTLHPVIHDP